MQHDDIFDQSISNSHLIVAGTTYREVYRTISEIRTPPSIGCSTLYLYYKIWYFAYIRDSWRWTISHVRGAIKSEKTRTASQATNSKLTATWRWRRHTVAALKSRLLCQTLTTVGTHQGTAVEDHWKVKEKCDFQNCKRPSNIFKNFFSILLYVKTFESRIGSYWWVIWK